MELEEGNVGSSVGLWHPPTFIVNLQFKCCSSVIYLTVTVLYLPHFFPLCTLWLLPFVPGIKRNIFPPSFYATAGSSLGSDNLKFVAALPV